MKTLLHTLLLFAITTLPAAASEAAAGHSLNMITTGLGIAALVIFVLAYGLVIAEEFIHLRKSKPVMQCHLQ